MKIKFLAIILLSSYCEQLITVDLETQIGIKFLTQDLATTTEQDNRYQLDGFEREFIACQRTSLNNKFDDTTKKKAIECIAAFQKFHTDYENPILTKEELESIASQEDVTEKDNLINAAKTTARNSLIENFAAQYLACRQNNRNPQHELESPKPTSSESKEPQATRGGWF